MAARKRADVVAAERAVIDQLAAVPPKVPAAERTVEMWPPSGVETPRFPIENDFGAMHIRLRDQKGYQAGITNIAHWTPYERHVVAAWLERMTDDVPAVVKPLPRTEARPSEPDAHYFRPEDATARCEPRRRRPEAVSSPLPEMSEAERRTVETVREEAALEKKLLSEETLLTSSDLKKALEIVNREVQKSGADTFKASDIQKQISLLEKHKADLVSVTDVPEPAPEDAEWVQVHLGESRYSSIQYNSFPVGGYTARVLLRPGETHADAARRVIPELEALAEAEFPRALEKYAQRVKEAKSRVGA